MVNRKELINYTNKLLSISDFHDYAPNGLQVEGSVEITKLVSAVTASQQAINAAVEKKAQALLVHHGYFWKGEDSCLVGMKKKRIQTLLENQINLIAYHLPLDAHSVYGNNSQLAALLGIRQTAVIETEMKPAILFSGELEESIDAVNFAARIAQKLNREPLHISGKAKNIRSIAWCTGGAQDFIEQAAAAGVDAYITGEVSERTVYVAREMGIHFFAAGHYATECGGVQALGKHLAERYELDYEFIADDNPV